MHALNARNLIYALDVSESQLEKLKHYWQIFVGLSTKNNFLRLLQKVMVQTHFSREWPEVYSEPNRTSKIQIFCDKS